MKARLFTAGILAVVFVASAYSQITIFTENVGSPSGTTSFAANTWQNSGTLTYAGTGDVRITTASTTYTGASGGGNVFLTNSGSAALIISGIDTSGYAAGSFELTMGAHKNLNASDMSELSVGYSTDGINFTSIPIPAQPTGSGTSVWRSITLSSLSLPSAENLYLRWLNTSTSVSFRIDDISLTAAIPEPSTYAAIIGALALVGVAIHRRRRAATTES